MSKDDDRTRIMSSKNQQTVIFKHSSSIAINSLQVILKQGGIPVGNPQVFQQSFKIGRASDNDLVLSFHLVSRHHLEIKRGVFAWYLQDLQAANGTLLNGQLVNGQVELKLPVSLQVGDENCILELSEYLQTDNQETQIAEVFTTQILKQPDRVSQLTPLSTQKKSRIAKDDISKEVIRARLLSESESADAGDYTKMLRALIKEDRSKRSKYYKRIIVGFGILAGVCLGFVIYQQLAIDKARHLAIEMFYDIKGLEVSLAKAEVSLDINKQKLQIEFDSGKNNQILFETKRQKLVEAKEKISQERKKLSAMRAKYHSYLDEINKLDLYLPTANNYEKRLIIKIAGELGESELEISPGFVKEVKKYIAYWQKTSRLSRSINRLEKNSYKPIILKALSEQNISRYFIYLPLQESDYEVNAVGPETRFGIAKGAWQFLAGTGAEFGLKVGDLAETRAYDASDERFDFIKASSAGSKYLKHIYSTEAQASGLLVMAAYNYGHNRVRGLIKAMPDNPRERNFWKFIQTHQIPNETYDYVFYIFSAAVIAEDPKHFGFDFKPVLSNN